MALGIADRSGTLEVGKVANLVILDGNPAEDIREIARVHAVVKEGRIHTRSEYERRRARR
jgi:imidazolonepropionase-like amidohydrolase